MAKLLIPTDTSQATLGYLLADGTIVGSTSQAQDFGSNGIKADVIVESTGAAGVAVPGLGTGGLTDYDLLVGDVTTPDYGIIRMGDSCMGRTSYNVASLDLDGAVIFRNMGGPVTNQIEFVWVESAGSSVIRFALPKAGVGNATYNPRSMLLAGPAVNDDDIVTVGYWQTNNSIFDNLACDTAGDGADLGVQNDLEVEGDIFTDSIKESTTGADITLGNDVDVVGTVDLDGLATSVGDGTPVPGFVVDFTGGRATCLTAGGSSAVFLFDEDGDFAIMARSRANTLAGIGAQASTRMRVTSADTGRLAVGKSADSPAYALDVFSNPDTVARFEGADHAIVLIVGTDDSERSVRLQSGATIRWLAGMDNSPVAFRPDYVIKQDNNEDPPFAFTTDCYLGINPAGLSARPVSTLEIHGSISFSVVNKTGAYTAAVTDHVITCDASGGAFTVTLPAASGLTGRIYHIKKTDSSGNAVTVDGNASETIDGDTTKVISTQYDSMMISCDGSNWHII